MKNVQIQPNGCWLWNMFVNDNGYGETRVAGVLKVLPCPQFELWQVAASLPVADTGAFQSTNRRNMAFPNTQPLVRELE